MSIKEGWTTLNARAKIGVVCMALASVLNFIFALAFMDAAIGAGNGIFGMLDSSFPSALRTVFVLYGILFTLLDLLIALFVIRHKNGARRLGLFWGIWGIINIAMSINNPSQWFVVYGLYVVSALCLLLAGKFKN